MKKRIVSVLMIVVLLAAVGILATQAEEITRTPQEIIAAANAMEQIPYVANDATEAPTIAASEGIVCPVCGTAKQWIPIIGASTWPGGGTYTNHYYLAKETVDLGTERIKNNGATTGMHIFLNNATITTKNTGCLFSSNGFMAIFGNGNVVNAYETTGVDAYAVQAGGDEIRIYGGNYSTVNGAATIGSWNTTAEIYLYGGTFTGHAGGYAVRAASTTNMFINGGTFVSGRADNVAVYAPSKTFGSAQNIEISNVTIDGIVALEKGTLTVGEGADLANVQITSSGSLNVTGGEITSLTSSSSGTVAVSGGAVETLNATKGTLAISGGSITTATPTGISVTLSGNPEITTLDLTGATLPITVSEMTEGADIGLDVAAGTTVATGLTEETAKFFSFIGDPLYKMAVDESGNMTTAAKTFETAEEIIDYANNHMDFSQSTRQYCPVCKATVNWSAITSATGNNLNGGGTDFKHYYVSAEGVETTAAFKNGASSRTTHVHLNNSNLTVENVDYAFSDYGNFVLMGDGNVTQKGTGAVLKSNGCSFKIYGGTYTATGDASSALLITYTDSVWDIYGGTFSGGATATANLMAAGSLNIHNATINGTIQSTVGNITISDGTVTAVNATGGTLAINGGEITTATVTGTKLSLSGAPEIGLLDLTGATNLPATVTNMKTGASIKLKVANDAVIAEDVDTAYGKYFTSDSAVYKISVDENNKLISTRRDFNNIEDIADYAENNMFFGYEGGNVTAFCPVCQAERTWQPRTEDYEYGLNFNGGGDKHVYLAQEEWTITSKIYTGKGATHLNLNGATITGNTGGVLFGNDTVDDTYGDKGFSIMGAGNVIQTVETGNMFHISGGYLNVYSGTYTTPGNMFYSQSENGVINVYGGTFNGTSTFSEGTLNLKGGSLKDTIQLLPVGDIYDDAATINIYYDGVSIDVNGRDNLTVGGTGEVTLFDSRSKETANGAVSAYGAVTITNENAVTADNYIRLSEPEGEYSFHYYETKLSGVALKTSGDKIGMCFSGQWITDSRLREVADVGVVVSREEQPTDTFFDTCLASVEDNTFFYYSYNAADVPNGESKPSVLVDGIMKGTTAKPLGTLENGDPETQADRDAQNSENGLNGVIYAAAYILIPSETENEEDYILKVSAPAEDVSTQTVYSVLNLFDDRDEDYEANKDALNALFSKWRSSMTTWAFDRIGKE